MWDPINPLQIVGNSVENFSRRSSSTLNLYSHPGVRADLSMQKIFCASPSCPAKWIRSCDVDACFVVASNLWVLRTSAWLHRTLIQCCSITRQMCHRVGFIVDNFPLSYTTDTDCWGLVEWIQWEKAQLVQGVPNCPVDLSFPGCSISRLFNLHPHRDVWSIAPPPSRPPLKQPFPPLPSLCLWSTDDLRVLRRTDGLVDCLLGPTLASGADLDLGVLSALTGASPSPVCSLWWLTGVEAEVCPFPAGLCWRGSRVRPAISRCNCWLWCPSLWLWSL